jgi:hypothetical protein
MPEGHLVAGNRSWGILGGRFRAILVAEGRFLGRELLLWAAFPCCREPQEERGKREKRGKGRDLKRPNGRSPRRLQILPMGGQAQILPGWFRMRLRGIRSRSKFRPLRCLGVSGGLIRQEYERVWRETARPDTAARAPDSDRRRPLRHRDTTFPKLVHACVLPSQEPPSGRLSSFN